MKTLTTTTIVCIAVVLLMMPGVQAFPPCTLVKTWGSFGNGDGQFNWPWGITVDPAGNVYVADPHNNRIEKFDDNGSFLLKWGSFGSGNGQFDGVDHNGPYGVVADADGNIFVTDAGPRTPSGNNRVQKFTSGGTFISKWGSYGSGDGQFSSPIGIGIDPSGYVYVADWYNFRIQKFAPDGTFKTKWGSEGSADGQLQYPQSVTADTAGNVYVADTYNHRIQKFDSRGNFLMKWGSFGSGDGQFWLPAGVVTDPSGNLYVSDSWNQRIQVFDSQGNFLTKWSVPSTYGFLQGIALDKEGNVYVVNNGYNRVDKFAPAGCISVNSDPAEAMIWIDGKNTGQKTPYTFTKSTGTHEIVVKKTCFEIPGVQTVTVTAEAITTADFTLVPDSTCVPEFPSPVIPAGVIAGCIGAVLVLNLRKSCIEKR